VAAVVLTLEDIECGKLDELKATTAATSIKLVSLVLTILRWVEKQFGHVRLTAIFKSVIVAAVVLTLEDIECGKLDELKATGYNIPVFIAINKEIKLVSLVLTILRWVEKQFGHVRLTAIFKSVIVILLMWPR
jgi:nitrous oxidase accessory protein NosD